MSKLAQNKTSQKIKAFASIKNRLDYPDFLDIQLKSFNDFLQIETKLKTVNQEGLFRSLMKTFLLPIQETTSC